MAKTKVKITGFQETSKRLTSFIDNVAKDQEIMTQTGKLIVDQIRARTASGVDPDYKQKKLTNATVKRRESLFKSGNKDPELSRVKPKTSGLVLSGQLLKSLRFEISASLQFIRISISDFRRAYKGIRKAELENNKTNTEIKNDLESRGRRFFFLSSRLKQLVQDNYSKLIKKKIKEAFYRRNNLKL